MLTTGTYTPHPNKGATLHPLWRFLISAIYVVGAQWTAEVFGTAVFPSHPLIADLLYRLAGCALLIGGFTFMLHVFDETDQSPIAAMGLPRRSGWVREILLGIVIGASMVSLAVMAIVSFGRVTLAVHLNAAALFTGAVVFFLLLVGAMFEELMFRGYPFQRLLDGVGPVAAILAISAVFAGMHLFNPHTGGFWSLGFLNTILAGVLFSVAYIRSRALWLPFGIHFGWNFALGMVYGLPVSGLHRFSVIVSGSAEGSVLLTGGAYGVEASLTGAVVVVLGVLIVLVATRNCQQVRPE